MAEKFSNRVHDFSDLRVYQRSFEMAMEIFQVSKQWPKSEQYSLTDQIRRSSRSVCSNISEAWFKRTYPKHFTSKLSDATSEAAESITWLHFAERCGYINRETMNSLESTYRQIIGGLVKMIRQPKKWCDASAIREPDASYKAFD